MQTYKNLQKKTNFFKKITIFVLGRLHPIHAKAMNGFYAPSYKMAEFLCKAPVFADGHFRGGWCNPVMEAMACGRVVVCTDTPCNSDFAIDGYNCIKVPVRDSASMKEAINSLLGNEVLMKEIQKNALDTASKYSYDKVCVDFEQWALSNI